MLEDELYFQNNIVTNMKNNYYWTKLWDENLYIQLAKKGFISTSYDTKDSLLLLPELQYDYAILDFDKLHISKKVKKLIEKNDATLNFNTKFDEVLKNLQKQHKYNWLKDDYAQLMKKLFKNKYENFKLISVELLSNEQELIAGEIGYIIGTTYTSLSGFSSKSKIHNNYGKLQLTLLAKYLQNKGFSFWNLGHPHMTYKQKLGALTYTREDFLKRWQKATKQTILL